MIHHPADISLFKAQALQWASCFNAVCYLDSNHFIDRYTKFDTLIAVGVKDELLAKTGTAFEQLAIFRERNPGWITGFFTYDLKNEIENLRSDNPDHLEFPELFFFAPEHILLINGGSVEIISDDEHLVLTQINQQIIAPDDLPEINLKSRFTKTDYIQTVNQIKEHISRGDIYVSNFCQEFFADDISLNPLDLFLQLNERSPNPFSSFFKYQDHYIICASPERFLAKRGSKLISQPIKGTAKRVNDLAEDEQIKQQLQSQPKELQENVMIVDLVRNDLTHSAKPGTVKTEELFGLHSFQQVHQLISTVVCELREDVSPIRAVKNTFPMGSMTGAPKISSMQLMEEYEASKRGVYSGAIGYFSPDDDFDFNVVIRSLLYNAANRYLSFQVGGAITFDADAEQEYEECLVKAQAILEVLGLPGSFPQS